MISWHVYQQLAAEFDISHDVMRQINIVADGGYLLGDAPPFLNFETPEAVGVPAKMFKENPAAAIDFYQSQHGEDGGLAAAIHAVGTEICTYSDDRDNVGYSLLHSHIDTFLDDLKTSGSSADISRLQTYFGDDQGDGGMMAHLDSSNSQGIGLMDLQEAHDDDKQPYRYCEHCGTKLSQSFVLRCPHCDTLFPGWATLVHAEAEEQGRTRWRQQLDVTVVTHNSATEFLIVEADRSLPGWVEASSRVGRITNTGLRYMGQVINTDGNEIHIDYEGAAAHGFSNGQTLTICSSESNIAATQQLGLLFEARREFTSWKQTANSATGSDATATTARLAENAPVLFEALDDTPLSCGDPAAPTNWQSLDGFELDDSQKRAVAKMLGLEEGDLSVVVGPPGSGKTEVIAKAADELANAGERVLVTSHTNIAVDNIIEKFIGDNQHQVIRAGRPAKLSKSTQELMLSKVIADSDDADVTKLLDAVEDLEAEISELTGTKRGGADGPEDRLTTLKRQLRELHEKAETKTARNADIVGATIVRSQLGGLGAVEFDTVILDEASQIPLPLGLLGLINARKWVVVGDHNQLRPVLKTVSTSNGNPPADASLFAFLRDRHDGEEWLQHHYRSHEDIIQFARDHIYEEDIVVDDACPAGFKWDTADDYPSRSAAITDGPPVTMVDVESQETWRKQFSGSVNFAEVDVVADIVKSLIRNGGIDPTEIGVITPFRGQRSLIADKLTEHGEVEVSTVDGFQGRERDVIVFSVVSTKTGGLRFAGNRNRFNVAATRAKEQFILVGNREAIAEDAPVGSTLGAYSKYASRNGAIFDWAEGWWDDGPPMEQPDGLKALQMTSGAGENEAKAGGEAESTWRDDRPWRETAVDETAYARVRDIVRLAPTNNTELADTWNMIDGREAWNYIQTELEPYAERDADRRIQPTAQARELVELNE